MKKTSWNKWILSAIVVLIACTMLIGYGCSESNDKFVNLGFIGPLTGPAASYGVSQMRGVELAVEEINSAGGIEGEKIKVIFEDSQMDPNKAISAIKKRIDIDKVLAIIGETTTTGTLAIANIANQGRTVLLSPLASGAKITDAGDYVFRVSPSDDFQAIVAAKFIFQKGLRNGAIVYTNDDWGAGLQKAFKEYFVGLGGSILAMEGCTPGTQDFRTQLVKIKNLNPDFIYIPLHPDESATFLRQVKEVKVPGQILGADNFSEKAILRTAGSAADGVIFTMPTKPTGEEFRNFSEKFKVRFNEDGSYNSAAAYDCVYILAEAIKRSGLSGENIKNALYNIRDYKGASGAIGFDENGDVTTKKFTVIKIKNGEYVPIKKQQ
jgi:branched-chain amino acid transport system substrate-binding protein